MSLLNSGPGNMIFDLLIIASSGPKQYDFIFHETYEAHWVPHKVYGKLKYQRKFHHSSMDKTKIARSYSDGTEGII